MKWATVTESTIDFRVSNLACLGPLNAAKKTIELILDQYSPPYHLMVSGGVDSQAMLYAWSLFGKNYIPTSVVYNTDYNLHDIYNIEKMASLCNKKIEYTHFDVLHFLENEYDSFSAQYRCSSPCISTHIKMVENINGTVIFSGDFLSATGTHLTDAILGLYRSSIYKKNIIPYFFLYTPELAYSFMCKNIDNTWLRSLNDYEKKVYMYTQSGFPVIPQETKISGFEKIKDYYDRVYWHSVPYINRLKYANKPSKRTFDLLYRYPYEEKYNDQPISFKINPL